MHLIPLLILVAVCVAAYLIFKKKSNKSDDVPPGQP